MTIPFQYDPKMRPLVGTYSAPDPALQLLAARTIAVNAQSPAEVLTFLDMLGIDVPDLRLRPDYLEFANARPF